MFTGCLSQERKLETLRKKEVDNISEYMARKEDRMDKKKDKNKQAVSGHETTQDSTFEQIPESEAKRPRLET